MTKYNIELWRNEQRMVEHIFHTEDEAVITDIECFINARLRHWSGSAKIKKKEKK